MGVADWCVGVTDWYIICSSTQNIQRFWAHKQAELLSRGLWNTKLSCVQLNKVTVQIWPYCNHHALLITVYLRCWVFGQCWLHLCLNPFLCRCFVTNSSDQIMVTVNTNWLFCADTFFGPIKLIYLVCLDQSTSIWFCRLGTVTLFNMKKNSKENTFTLISQGLQCNF